MCGLTALIGTDIEQVHVLAFQKLAQLSALRGQDSVGFFDFHLRPARNEKECRYYKELGSAGLYFGEGGRWDNSFYWNRYFTKKNVFNAPVVMVAHARAATKGAVEKKNAHPFHRGDILGVHNGTIHNTFENREKFDTDSEALFAYMNANGEAKGLDMVNQLWSAAYALLWVNLKERTFNIARSQERTLFYTKHKHKDVAFLSSDKLFLQAVLQYISKDFEEVLLLPKEEWFVFSLNRKDLLSTQETVKIKARTHVVVPSHDNANKGQSGGFFPRVVGAQTTNSNNVGNAGSTQNSGGNKSPIWDVTDVLADELTEEDVPYRMRIYDRIVNDANVYEVRPGVNKTFQEATKLLSAGCECCATKPHTYEEVYFFKDETTFLCGSCGNNIDAVRTVAEDVKNRLEAIEIRTQNNITNIDVTCH